MILVDKRSFSLGVFLALTFFGVLGLLFLPVFSSGKNGLQFADEIFNSLAKGSSYFIPKVVERNEQFKGIFFSLVIRQDDPGQRSPIMKLLTAAGIAVKDENSELRVSGDLGKLMSTILRDADDLYGNRGEVVSQRHGLEEKKVMVSWWQALSDMNKELNKQKRFKEAELVSEVMKKAVEPAYNFYGIETRTVSKSAGVMTGLLAFYVLYTIWWGFAIFYLFEGLGLTMKKADRRTLLRRREPPVEPRDRAPGNRRQTPPDRRREDDPA
jgi:hypothetical protein